MIITSLCPYLKRWYEVLRVKRLPKRRRQKPIDVVDELWHGTVMVNYHRSKFVFVQTYTKDSSIALIRIGTVSLLVPKNELHWKCAIRRRRLWNVALEQKIEVKPVQDIFV